MTEKNRLIERRFPNNPLLQSYTTPWHVAGHSDHFSRRRFILLGGVLMVGAWLSPRRRLFAEVENIVVAARKRAETATVTVQPLHGNVTALIGSGGNIAVLTGPDGKLIIDSGYATSRAKITDALANLSPDPIKHLVNTHWHFDHCDGNEWMHEDGAHILAHENTRKHLATSTRVKGWILLFRRPPQARFQVKFLPTKRHCTSMVPRLRLNITARAIRMAISRPTSQKQMSFIAATLGGMVIIHSSIIPPAGTSKV